MTTCDRARQVHAYHDGELPAGDAEAFEQHLEACAPCRELLAELRGLSGLLARTPMAQAETGIADRLEQVWQARQDRAVLRIASWMTAAAAAVLVFGLVRTAGDFRTETPVREPQVWQTVAVMPPLSAELRDEPRAETIVVAQWMADELSIRERQ